MATTDTLSQQVQQELRELMAIQAAQTFLLDLTARIVLVHFPADTRAGLIETMKGVDIVDTPLSQEAQEIARMTRDFLEGFGNRLHAAFEPTGQRPN